MGLIIVGGILFLAALLYLFAPGIIKKINQILNKVLFQDEITFAHRILTALLFLATSLYMIITGIFLIKK